MTTSRYVVTFDNVFLQSTLTLDDAIALAKVWRGAVWDMESETCLLSHGSVPVGDPEFFARLRELAKAHVIAGDYRDYHEVDS